MNTVAVTVYAKQGDWDSTNLWWEQEEPWVIAEARAARRRGLDVVLVLRVALDHAFERNKFFWHGMIMPDSDQALDLWFDRYSDYVLKWARIADEEGIDVLAIGSELNSLTNTVPVDELPALEEYWSNVPLNLFIVLMSDAPAVSASTSIAVANLTMDSDRASTSSTERPSFFIES